MKPHLKKRYRLWELYDSQGVLWGTFSTIRYAIDFVRRYYS